jgi:predicted LPLAT superfamily acyltransferase
MSTLWNERREAGGRFAMRALCAFGQLCGRTCARLALYPIALYFFFRRKRERADSRAYLSRVFARPARRSEILRHFYSYAATIFDRLFLLTDVELQRFAVNVHGIDELNTLMARGKGVLLLGGHIGSFEVLRTLSAERPDVRVRVVMDLKQTQVLNETLHAFNPAIAANVIHAGDDPGSLALALHEAAQAGDLIGLLADRARPGEATVDAEFLGAPAAFPIAPYVIASMLGLPVMFCAGIYRGGNRYDLYFETFAEEIKLPREQRKVLLREWTQRFASRLEHYTRLAPYNWFNFYDFWHRSADEPVVQRTAVARRLA